MRGALDAAGLLGVHRGALSHLAAELDAAVTLIRAEGLPAFCRALFNANEFVYVF